MADPATRPDPAAELVEVVDSEGQIIELASRGRMRAQQLRHRSTYVAVLAHATASLEITPGVALSPETELVVHRRAGWKDVFPSYWDVAFGGVCGVGESWVEAAERELQEEAGISGVGLLDRGPGAYDEPPIRVVARIYTVAWSGALVCDDGEVESIDRVPLAEIDRWQSGRAVCPDSVALVIPKLKAMLQPGWQ